MAQVDEPRRPALPDIFVALDDLRASRALREQADSVARRAKQREDAAAKVFEQMYDAAFGRVAYMECCALERTVSEIRRQMLGETTPSGPADKE